MGQGESLVPHDLAKFLEQLLYNLLTIGGDSQLGTGGIHRILSIPISFRLLFLVHEEEQAE